MYRLPAPHKFVGLCRVFFSTKCSILNINAFRPVIRQKKIFEGFCYIIYHMENINAFRPVVYEKKIFKRFCYINLYKIMSP